MLDQSTQAFFPERIHDATTVQDADWATVTAYFGLLRDVTELDEGAFQVIVCGHANLTDEEWFQKAIVENWHATQRRPRPRVPKAARQPANSRVSRGSFQALRRRTVSSA